MTMTSSSVASKCVPDCADRPSVPASVILPLPPWAAMSARLLDPRLREPVEVVEAAVQVAALLERGALVAEQLVDLAVVVERDDRLRPDGLEEGRAAHRLQQLERAGVVELGEPPAGELDEALLELCGRAGVLAGGGEDRVGGALVGAVGERGV